MKFRNKKTGEIREWGPVLINSALLSAQQRKRYYWTNWHVEQPQDKGILLKDILESGQSWKEKSPCIDACYYKGGNFTSPQKQSGQRNMVAEPITKRSLNNLRTPENKANCLLSTSWKGAQANGMTTVPERIGELNGLSKAQGNRIYSVRGKSVCLGANGGGGGAKTGLYKVDLPDGDYIIRKLTPVECARLQTMPDNWCDGISATQQYKCYGNGWTVDVIAHILKQLPTE